MFAYLNIYLYDQHIISKIEALVESVVEPVLNNLKLLFDSPSSKMKQLHRICIEDLVLYMFKCITYIDIIINQQ